MTERSSHVDTPFYINFEQQKKRAKDLRRDLQSGDQHAVHRFTIHHPKAAGLSAELITAELSQLGAAQLVIARELGLASWAKLKVHALALATAGQEIQQSGVAPDVNRGTLHIRCGTDVKKTLENAGFSGEFLEYSNPFCQGPVIVGPDMVEARATFLSGYYGMHSYDETLKGLQAEEAELASAAQRYERVVLWFEHDSFDQLILIRLLSYFAENGSPEILELVELNHFPGSIRFIGIGQLPPEAIRMLWRTRKPVTDQQLALGKKAWEALCSSDPTSLAQLEQTPNLALPNLGKAVHRHLQELPSTVNGLGLTEIFILEALMEGHRTAGQIFRDLMVEKEPLPWLGDLMFWGILKAMTRASSPVIEVLSQSGHPGTSADPLAGTCDWLSTLEPRQINLTKLGSDVLAGKIDWLSLKPETRWLGGIEIDASRSCWRWDVHSHKPVFT